MKTPFILNEYIISNSYGIPKCKLWKIKDKYIFKPEWKYQIYERYHKYCILDNIYQVGFTNDLYLSEEEMELYFSEMDFFYPPKKITKDLDEKAKNLQNSIIEDLKNNVQKRIIKEKNEISGQYSIDFLLDTSVIKFVSYRRHKFWMSGDYCKATNYYYSNEIKKIKKLWEEKVINDRNNFVKNLYGGELLSNELTFNNHGLEWKCCKGHEFVMSWNNVKYEHWCPECADKNKGEKLTRYCFVKIFGCYFDKIRPDWIRNPKTGQKLELDGYNSDLKIAFEHQGIHHEEDCPKDNFFYKEDQLFKDNVKREKCKEHGITLIEVPEIGRRLKVKEVVSFLLNEFEKNNIAYPESAKSFQIDMKEFYAEYMN
jgi:hypothetical protein